jgi:predicted Zn-dependent protease
MRRTVLATVLLIPFASAAVGALNLISVNDEIALGRRAQQEVRQQVPELRDRTVSGYIENLGRRIAARADGPRFPYTFDVANSREVNAFALPGGPIWINRGTIDAAQTEAQLAGVIAHEIAHIANRHAAEQITKGTFANVGLGILGAILGGEGRASQIAHRDAEREADTKALQYMRRAGYDPRGMVEFLRILRTQQGRDGGSAATFFSSHPAPADRINRLQQQANRLAGGRRTSTSFQQVQARLDRMGR